MKFTEYDLGILEKGTVVKITLEGSAANVHLLDDINLSYYRNGQSYQYVGGLAKKSPIMLKTPHSGHWHVTVDLLGLRGTVKNNVQVISA
jgi:hypothetical protein